jgi:hypothetical protein
MPGGIYSLLPPLKPERLLLAAGKIMPPYLKEKKKLGMGLLAILHG